MAPLFLSNKLQPIYNQSPPFTTYHHSQDSLKMGTENNQQEENDHDRSVRLQIVEESNQANVMKGTDSWVSTVFEPQREQYHVDAVRTAANTMEAPEKKLTLFAFRLAILEKSASGIGALGFIWATVVLLGGFAIALEKKDFWFVTVILLIEGNRIFSRSHELEWQHQATWSITEAGRYSFRAIKTSSRFVTKAIKFSFRPFPVASSDSRQRSNLADGASRVALARSTTDAPSTRSWNSQDVPLLPYASWVFLSRNISKILYWLQILSACACVSLSLMRLSQQDYGKIDSQDRERKNLKSALDIFYSLALAEALLFLTEKSYWEWKVSYRKLLDQVNGECDFGPLGMVSIKRFFYDSYSRCVNGSIFDGLKMDLVSFAEELLASNSRDEQLIGARILHKFVTSQRFADETLRKIGTSTLAIERLMEMLNWKNPTEEEIRKSAAVVVSKLAGKKQNALRVAGIPGAMESISSLLFTGRSSRSKPDEICHRSIIADQADYEFSAFNHLGLLVLKKLASDHDNCGKIGNTRGLLAKIIDFTSINARSCRMKCTSDSQIRAVKRSLEVVKMLASTTGHTGKVLRQEISEIVFTVSNIREILQHAENHLMLQKLGIEVLTSLAMDEEAREKIGSTGGMIKELLRLFFREGCATQQEIELRMEAGEALAMLALENERNCERILKKSQVVERLVASLTDPVVRISSLRILKNLCAFDGTECVSRLRGVAAAIPIVLNAIMAEEMKLLEVSLGLATQIFRFISYEEYVEELEKAGIREFQFAERLVQLLKTYNYPSIKVPRIRRFLIELAIWLMTSDGKYAKLFNDFGMEIELENVAETMSELECFNVFSGSVGLSRHTRPLSSLVETALKLISEG